MWRFKSILKPTIWGGSRISTYKARTDTASVAGFDGSLPIGESLELSALPGAVSVVADGADAGLTLNELIAREGAQLMGREHIRRYGALFPLLVKILDAGQDLSVQVHPDDEMAARLSLPYGKSEMWYVVAADPQARLCIGLTRPINAREYHSLVADARFSDVLCYRDARPGEAFFIPAGVVHALGKGCMVIEIQQTCDTTFRIYDYDRTDKNGRRRELHTERAIEALHTSEPLEGHIPYSDQPGHPVNLLDTPQFSINRLRLAEPYKRDYAGLDSFRVIVVAQGMARLDDGLSTAIEARAGSVWLVPACSTALNIEPLGGECVLLESYINI